MADDPHRSPEDPAGGARTLLPAQREKGRVDDTQLRAIAAQRVAGWTVVELAHHYGYEPSGMRGLLESERGKGALEVAQARVQEAGARALAKFQLAAEDIAARVVARARDDQDDKCFEAQKFVLSSILPQRTQAAVENNVVFNQQTNNVLVSLGETLSGLKNALNQSPVSDDAPSYNAFIASDGEDLETPPTPTEGNSNGNSGDRSP